MTRTPLAIAVAVLAGCAAPPRPFPVWTGEDHRVPPQTVDAAARDQDADMHAAAASLASRAPRPLNVLALSSGGQSGAFGAGLIEGWGASGTRPEFDLVTGVSTGALIGVFAFLGDDATLRAMYTTHATSDLITPYPWVSVLSSSAYAASTPMRATIARYVTEDLVRAIGREAARGRVLLISTANLDLNTVRFWNMTALAADESRALADRVARFRDILAASISIPGLVPPVFLDGCMHADGGVVRQAFITDGAHADLLAGALRHGDGPGPDIWLVVNRRIGSPPRVVRNQIIPIATRSIQMMIDAALVRDIDEIRRFAAAVDGRLAVASLPHDPQRPPPEGFLDPGYMGRIHAIGLRLGATAAAWSPDPSAVGPSAAPQGAPDR